jgi:hypothetical protein
LCLIALASSMRNGSSLNAVLVVDVPTKHNKSKTNSWYF